MARRAHQLLAAAIVVLMAAGALVARADAQPDEARVEIAAAAADALAQVPPPEPEPRVDPVADIVVRVPESVELPVPEPPPANPYAPTPEIRHGTLELPSVGLSQPLFEGVTLTSINRGPSHWPGTAMPGELGNVVVAGHRTTYTRPFWDLDLLQPGDELVFTTDAGTFTYLLDSLEVVPPSAVHIVEQTDAHTATLFACHPKGSARQRIVAHFTMEPPARISAA